MSVRSLIAYPLQSPFYPPILPYYTLMQDAYFTNETLLVAGDSDIAVNLPCAIPANAVVVFYILNLQGENVYNSAEIRVGSCLYNQGTGTVQYVIRARGLGGNRRSIQDFNIQYYIPPA